MINSRLIRLFETLSKKELRELKNWINSPIHNQHKDVCKIFEYLCLKKNITKVTVQRKRVFSYVFLNEEYDEHKLNIVMSYALSLLKGFIGYNEVLLDEFSFKKGSIQSLRRRGMVDLAQQELQKTKQKIQQEINLNAQKALQEYELEVEEFELLGAQKRSGETNLPMIFNHLTTFYSISMLKYACEAISHSNITKQAYEIPLLNVLLEQAVDNEHPIVQLYYNAYQTLAKPEEDQYFKQTELNFLEESQRLDKREQRDILLILINYSIKRLNTGASEYRRKAFEWYKWGLENSILFEDEILSRFAYSNIVSLGLKLQEFDWVGLFILEYAPFIPEQYRANYIHYNTAKLHFNKKDYTKAQSLLIQVEYDDIFLNLDAKTMLLEMYYEEKSFDALEALLVSFSRFLQRKSVIAYHKQVYKSIIHLIRKMLHIAPYDKAAKVALRKEIEKTNPFAERDWLLIQLEKL